MIWPICLILRVSTSMTAINCDQFAKILDDKLSPLNSRIAELKRSVDQAMNHVEFVNAKYDEFLQMSKTSNDERKALKDENKILQDENKILKATIDSIENHWNQSRVLLLLIHEKSKPTVLSRMSVNYWEWILLKTTYQFANECLKGKPQDHRLS